MKQINLLVIIIFIVLSKVYITKGEDSIGYNSSIFNNSVISNWTNCSSFVANSNLNISAIIDIDWVIFYFWTTDGEDSFTFRFSRPSDLLIKRIRESMTYEPEPPANWSNAELFLDTSVDMSGLFLKTDTPGLYRLIPTVYMEYKLVTEILFGFKLVDGYLAFMNCDGRMAIALAPANKMPKKDEVYKIAAKFNFWNPFGKSYYDIIKDLYTFDHPEPTELDDDEEDEDFQIEKSRKAFNMF